jgi:hypothetical protein
MSTLIRFEFERIKSNGRLVGLCILFFFLSLAFVFEGIQAYLTLVSGQEDFKDYQVEKVEGYLNYDQYGGYGFTIRAVPSPIVVFFDINPEMMESKIDDRETVDVSTSEREKNYSGNYFKGFSAFVIFWGGFLQIFLGVTTFKSKKNIAMHKKIKTAVITVVLRLVLSIAFFGLLYLIAFIFANFFLDFTTFEMKVYIKYVLSDITLIASFFVIGILVFIAGKKKNHFIIVLISWLGLSFAPQGLTSTSFKNTSSKLINKVNVKKLKLAKKWEKKAYKRYKELMKEGKEKTEIYNEILPTYEEVDKLNRRMEWKLIEKEKEDANYNEQIACYFPSLHHLLLGLELGGGKGNYFEFLEYIIFLKKVFKEWYLDKKFFDPDKKIVPFLNRDEYVYALKPYLIPTYNKGISITVGLILVLLIISQMLVKKGFCYNSKKKRLREEYKPGFYFRLIGDSELRRKKFKSYEEFDVIRLDDISDEDFDLNVSRNVLISYLVTIREVEISKAQKRLQSFNISIEDNRKIESNEDLKKVHAAISLAESGKLFVINNVVKNRSIEFDEQFRDMISSMVDEGKSIIYLGSEPVESEARKKLYKDKLNLSAKQMDVRIISCR